MTETTLHRPTVLVLPPNWFAAVMGTGIVAVAGAALRTDARLSGAPRLAVDIGLAVMWLGAAALLTAIAVIAVRAWRHAPDHARAHLGDPSVAPFHGAIPMALMTVGAGTLLLGADVDLAAAIAIDLVLWISGTALGVAGAVGLVVRAIRGGWLAIDAAWGGWLMPVVPPMVSASTGALLLPHTVGAARTALLVSCTALALLSAALAVPVLAAIAHRFARHGRTDSGLGHPRTAPTLWIGLGPLGQGATAAAGLGAPTVVCVGALAAAGAWAAVAVAGTHRALTGPGGLPFSLAWWGFVFPLGTCVTGIAALAHRLGSNALLHTALALYVVVVGAWLVVGLRTLRGALDGRLIPLAAQPDIERRVSRLAW